MPNPSWTFVADCYSSLLQRPDKYGLVCDSDESQTHARFGPSGVIIVLATALSWVYI